MSRTIRWPHIERYIAHKAELRERALARWRKAGYADLAAHGEYLDYRAAVMHANSTSTKYTPVENNS